MKDRHDKNLEEDINIVELYLKEISIYPVLSKEEEKELGDNIREFKNLDIIWNKKNNNLMPVIDLSKVFVSLTEENYDFIFDTLSSYYRNKTTLNDQVVFRTLNRYNDLHNELGRILTIDELNLYFSDNAMFNYFEEEQKIDLKDLLKQINNFIIYKESYEKMVNHNLRLVVDIAKRKNGNFSILDVIEEGNLALIKAVKSFDSSLDYKFSTYASKAIKRSINSYAIDSSTHLKVTDEFKKDLNDFNIKLALLRQERGELESSEISEILDIPLAKVDEYLLYNNTILSLSTSINTEDENSKLTLEDVVAGKENVEKDIIAIDVKNRINILLDKLSENEKRVIKFRFGIDELDGKAYSHVEVGKKMHIPTYKVRKLENKAIVKMRRIAERDEEIKNLKDYI